MASTSKGSTNDSAIAHRASWENEVIEDEIVQRIEQERDDIADDEEAAEFIRKYGEIKYQYIQRPRRQFGL